MSAALLVIDMQQGSSTEATPRHDTEGVVQRINAMAVRFRNAGLPVVWIQMRLHRMAITARDTGTPLPDSYWRLYRIWFACGFPAFAAVLAILWLMLMKPAF